MRHAYRKFLLADGAQRRHQGAICVAFASALAVATPASASAAANGLIAFQSTGTPTRIATVDPGVGSGVATGKLVPRLPGNSVSPAWSPDGRMLAFANVATGSAGVSIEDDETAPVAPSGGGSEDIDVINADGTGLRQITKDPVAAKSPTWSPDGTRIAFTSLRDGQAEIYVTDVATGVEERLTDDPGVDWRPAWSPDGRRIAFVSNRGGAYAIWLMASDGTSQTALTKGAKPDVSVAWSPNGRRLAFARKVRPSASVIFSVAARKGGKPKALTKARAATSFPTWSPDGRQIAFSQKGQVRVMPSSGLLGGARSRVVARSATRPVWGVVPDATATATGTVTVKTPGGAEKPVTSGTELPVGSRVDATQGSLVMTFRRPGAPAGTPVTSAQVADAVFRIAARTSQAMSLVVAPPSCAGGVVAAVVKKRKTTVKVKANKRSGEVNVRNDHIIAAPRGTTYTMTETCNQGIVTVTQGSVTVQARKGKPRRTVVRAGHRYVVAFPL